MTSSSASPTTARRTCTTTRPSPFTSRTSTRRPTPPPSPSTGNEDPTGPAYIPITITGTDVDAGDSVASFHITNIPNTGTQGTLYSDIGLTTQVTEGADVAASGNAATLYFVPNANFNTHAGAVTFNAAATDNHGLTDATPATETINVTAVNDAPVNNGVPSSFITAVRLHPRHHRPVDFRRRRQRGRHPTDITTTLHGRRRHGEHRQRHQRRDRRHCRRRHRHHQRQRHGGADRHDRADQHHAVRQQRRLYRGRRRRQPPRRRCRWPPTTTATTAPAARITDTDTINIGVIPQVWFINQDQTGADPNRPARLADQSVRHRRPSSTPRAAPASTTTSMSRPAPTAATAST